MPLHIAELFTSSRLLFATIRRYWPPLASLVAYTLEGRHTPLVGHAHRLATLRIRRHYARNRRHITCTAIHCSGEYAAIITAAYMKASRHIGMHYRHVVNISWHCWHIGHVHNGRHTGTPHTVRSTYASHWLPLASLSLARMANWLSGAIRQLPNTYDDIARRRPNRRHFHASAG